MLFEVANIFAGCGFGFRFNFSGGQDAHPTTNNNGGGGTGILPVIRGGQDAHPTTNNHYCGTGPKACYAVNVRIVRNVREMAII
ncbi:hypothetical protein QUB63_29465 [Microcoleus sp. ARI1-B5]|uniref:hypothetical protein n=1 Tax=unclassified Microcoleus TaxID=2642155 RepID=UPI002FD71AAA